jgi:hypothetical protein
MSPASGSRRRSGIPGEGLRSGVPAVDVSLVPVGTEAETAALVDAAFVSAGAAPAGRFDREPARSSVGNDEGVERLFSTGLGLRETSPTGSGGACSGRAILTAVDGATACCGLEERHATAPKPPRTPTITPDAAAKPMRMAARRRVRRSPVTS